MRNHLDWVQKAEGTSSAGVTYQRRRHRVIAVVFAVASTCLVPLSALLSLFPVTLVEYSEFYGFIHIISHLLHRTPFQFLFCRTCTLLVCSTFCYSALGKHFHIILSSFLLFALKILLNSHLDHKLFLYAQISQTFKNSAFSTYGTFRTFI